MRHARVVACTATAALLTTAAGVSSAAAATAHKDLSYSSTTKTGVVELVVNLPASLPALPGIPNPLELTLLGTDATDYHAANGTSADVATAHSYLAGGSLVTDSALAAVLGPLNRTVTSDLTHPGPKVASVLTVPSNPLGLALSVGSQKADVSAVTKALSSSGNVTSASLGSLSSLGVGALLSPALTTLNTALTTVTNQTSALTSGLSAVPTLPTVAVPNPLLGILGGPATITTPALSGSTLSTAVSELPAQVQALTDKLLNGACVQINGVDTSQGITPAVNAIGATASSHLLSVDLFGGLVSVKATDALASAQAGLTKGAAVTGASATLLTVKVSDSVGDLLKVVASDKGITAGLLNGTLGQTLSNVTKPIVQTVNDALATILTQLTTLLSELNSGAALIQQGTVSQKVSPDGHQAEAHAVPAQVLIGLPVAPNLLTIAVGKADAVSALSVANPTVVPTTPQDLPRTGASEAAGALALLLLVAAGGTVVLRRRHAS